MVRSHRAGAGRLGHLTNRVMAGHPCLALPAQAKSWVTGPSPVMTQSQQPPRAGRLPKPTAVPHSRRIRHASASRGDQGFGRQTNRAIAGYVPATQSTAQSPGLARPPNQSCHRRAWPRYPTTRVMAGPGPATQPPVSWPGLARPPTTCGAGPGQSLLSAPMAPAAWSTPGGNRRTERPSTPPSAAIVTLCPARLARAAQRNGPRPGAPTWLAVGNAGDTNTRHAPIRPARRRSATEWAELVTSPGPRIGAGR